MPLNELIATAAQRGAAINPCHGKMCNDCAFKPGTDANNDDAAVNAAMDCLVGFGKFNCHKEQGAELVDAGKPCAGFLYAKQYYEKMDKELEEKDAEDLQKQITEHVKTCHEYQFYDTLEEEMFDDFEKENLPVN